MRVIVTGATSFIGRVIAKELLAGGHHVFTVVRPGSPGLPQLEVLAPETEGKSGRRGECPTFLSFALEDIRKLEPCPALVPLSVLRPHSAPKGVVGLQPHLDWEGAGSVDHQDPHVQARNIGYALDSLHTMTYLGCARFLFCGSQAGYGIMDGIMGEETLCHPISEHGKDELGACRRAGEDAKALDINYIHTRVFSAYSPEGHPWSLASTCLNTFLKGGRMELGACTQQWNFLHVRDATRALIGFLLAKVPAGVYNVAGEDARSLKSFVEQMHRLHGEKDTCEYGKRSPNVEGVVFLVPDTRKLKKAAGFAQEISFEDGIGEIIGTYKEDYL